MGSTNRMALRRSDDTGDITGIPLPMKLSGAIMLREALKNTTDIAVPISGGDSGAGPLPEARTPRAMVREPRALGGSTTPRPPIAGGATTPRQVFGNRAVTPRRITPSARHTPAPSRDCTPVRGFNECGLGLQRSKSTPDLQECAFVSPHRERSAKDLRCSPVSGASPGRLGQAYRTPRRGAAQEMVTAVSQGIEHGTVSSKAAWANALLHQQKRQENCFEEIVKAKAVLNELTLQEAHHSEAARAHIAQIEETKQGHAERLSALCERKERTLQAISARRAEIARDEKDNKQKLADAKSKKANLAQQKECLSKLEKMNASTSGVTSEKDDRLKHYQQIVAREQAALDARCSTEAKVVAHARRLHNEYLSLKGNIRVFCRVRPQVKGENEEMLDLSIQDDTQLKVHSGPQKTVTGAERSPTSWDFTFDHIFGPDASQAAIFDEISMLVQSALDGYRVAIFAYGQTGSGKTYTMEGFELEKGGGRGVIPRAVDLIFQQVQELEEKGWTFEVYVTILEVYNETVYDLLATRSSTKETPHLGSAIIDDRDKPTGAERGSVDQSNMRRVRAENATAVHAMVRRANRERHVAATCCNDRSSRSHAVFQLSLTGSCKVDGKRCEGLLSLVDLAGSERVELSGATGDRLKEAQHINRSLSALGHVVEAIARRGQSSAKSAATSHVPYRNSQLTKLLKDSLGGESKTLMFVNISPCLQHLGETISSLRFASKVHVCKVGTGKRNVGEAKPQEEVCCTSVGLNRSRSCPPSRMMT